MLNPLVEALKIKADAEGLGVRAFARKLDVSAAMWCKALQGQPIGGSFIRRALAVYPDLEPLAAVALRKINDHDLSSEPAAVPA